MVVSIAMPDENASVPIPSSVGRPMEYPPRTPPYQSIYLAVERRKKGGPGVALGVSPEIGYVSELPEIYLG